MCKRRWCNVRLDVSRCLHSARTSLGITTSLCQSEDKEDETVYGISMVAFIVSVKDRRNSDEPGCASSEVEKAKKIELT